LRCILGIFASIVIEVVVGLCCSFGGGRDSYLFVEDTTTANGATKGDDVMSRPDGYTSTGGGIRSIFRKNNRPRAQGRSTGGGIRSVVRKNNRPRAQGRECKVRWDGGGSGFGRRFRRRRRFVFGQSFAVDSIASFGDWNWGLYCRWQTGWRRYLWTSIALC